MTCCLFPQRTKDRHRWIPSYKKTLQFVENNAQGLQFEAKGFIYSYKKWKFLSWIDRFFFMFCPNLFAHDVFVHILK